MMPASIVSSNINNILTLNGSNFKGWKGNILITLGCMDLDYALRIDNQRRYYEKWEHLNRISLLIIRCSIPEAFRGTAFASDYITEASEYLAKIKERFAKNDKAETSMLDLNKE